MTRVAVGFQDKDAFEKLQQEIWANWTKHYTKYTAASPKKGTVETIIAVDTDSEELIALLQNSGGRMITSPEEMEALLDYSEGDRDGGVIRLKQLLKDKGFYHGFCDPSFGPDTKAAVIAFQQANDLPPDGIVGPKTWAKLKARN
jgi:peptidoglycan hydrolase-like protein with peptidoglycan-binding domain